MTEPSVLRRLYAAPYEFDFFQAVRLLGRVRGGLLAEDRAARRDLWEPPVPARFRGRASLAFPPSPIYDLQPPADAFGLPALTVTFFGLYGTTGVLPRHYTHRLMEIDQSTPQAAGRPLRDWLDLLHHRWVWHFYRAWEKYRFWLPYERGEASRTDPDAFTRTLLAVCGLATDGLRDRVRVDGPPPGSAPPAPREPSAPGRVPVELPPRPDEPRPLGVVNDLGLLRFAGLLGPRRRNGWGLDVLLAEYFDVPVAVQPFRGQWLPLDTGSRTRLGAGNCGIGKDAVAGERVWDVQGKYRLRVGPLTYGQFLEYLPDRRPDERRKSFFLLCQVAKLYAGPEFDLDVQLVLKAADVPKCRLTADEAAGPRLGWNCWVLSGAARRDAEEAIFEGQAVTVLGERGA